MLRRSLTIASGLFVLLIATDLHAQPMKPQLVFFDEWSAALDGPAQSIIAEAAKLASQSPGNRVLVTGFADRLGSVEAVADLSHLRAQVVTDGLIAGGVDRQLIDVETGRSVSSQEVVGRRVEITVGSKE
jgi:outer membrane protein OmpA-like peptidoglycan-associated protein